MKKNDTRMRLRAIRMSPKALSYRLLSIIRISPIRFLVFKSLWELTARDMRLLLQSCALRVERIGFRVQDLDRRWPVSLGQPCVAYSEVKSLTQAEIHEKGRFFWNPPEALDPKPQALNFKP